MAGSGFPAEMGSTPAQKVKEALPSVQLQEFDTCSSCVEALSQGTIDAMTTDATILNGCPLRCSYCHNPQLQVFGPGSYSRPVRA